MVYSVSLSERMNVLFVFAEHYRVDQSAQFT